MTSTPAWISLGSNLGDRRTILDAAVAALGQTPGIAVAAVSSYRETRPVGGPPGQGPFLNAAARLDTTLGPRELLHALQAIEEDLGRVRTVRWGERTLDLDILMFGSKFVDEPDLKLPHPRMAVRRFVLEPLAEIAPHIVDTVTRTTISDLLANLLGQPKVLMVEESMQSILAKHMRTFAASLPAIVVLANHDREPVPLYNYSQFGYLREILNQLDAFEKADQLRRASGYGWLVANFVSHLSSLKSRQSRLDQVNLWPRNLNARLANIPDPTLILAGPQSKRSRQPNGSRIPVYWTETTDPDAIVAEVVAVCRGIEAT